jgi:AraC family transcriptional regulator
MDGSKASAYPHYSWLAHWVAIRRPNVFELYESRHVSHRVLLTTDGDANVVWTSAGVEVPFHAGMGDIGFFPCDFAMHSLALSSAAGYRGYELCIPEAHLRGVCDAEDLRVPNDPRARPFFRDALMRASLLRLSNGTNQRSISEDIGDEIAARQIILRLLALGGTSCPDWQKDFSVFAPHVMRRIVERVDSSLCARVSLEQVSGGFGLSPSHFARKFHQSTGLSLNRFMNRRRIGQSFALLRMDGPSLAQLSLDLGFASQSHFTRVFSGLTGFTPYQFRRLHHRMGE